MKFHFPVIVIDEDFRTTSGFISRPGLMYAVMEHRGTWFNQRGKLLETLTRVAKADAFASEAALGNAWSVIPHAQDQAFAFAARLDLDAAFFVDLAHAVLDGVLHQRLQDEVRHQRI